MVNLKSTNHQEPKALTTINNRELRFHYLVGLIVTSILFHGLGLFLYAKFQPQDVILSNKSSSKSIDFVVVEPPESKKEELPPAKEQKIKEPVAEPNIKSNQPKILEAQPAPAVITPPTPIPEPVTPEPEPVAPIPEAAKTPELDTPIISGKDPAQVSSSELEPKPTSKPESKKAESIPEPSSETEKPIATASPSAETSQPSTTESTPTEPANSANETDKIATGSGAASLLGGGLEKNYKEDGAQAFFSPEALAHEAVLNPQQLEALKDFDLEGYQKRLYEKVKRNWQPSFRQKYTTRLKFNIEKNGQISQLQVVESSGSTEFDQVALAAVRDAVPLEPLPSDFPLENLEFKYQFYLY